MDTEIKNRDYWKRREQEIRDKLSSFDCGTPLFTALHELEKEAYYRKRRRERQKL
jgi:hypothetical protein